MKRLNLFGWLNLKVLLILGMLGIIFYLPLRIELTRFFVPNPQGILILGGDRQRVKSGAELAAQYSELPIWLTGYFQDRTAIDAYFDRRHIALDRLHYDTCATDTVTDFTCTVAQLSQHQIHHVYLVTSDYHMARATAIAWWVLGSRGIIFSPYPVRCRGAKCRPPESRWRIVRDRFRAIAWVLTGKSGASLNPRLLSHLNPPP